MYAYVVRDYTLSDIERFVALSIRRGSTLASIEKNDPTLADLKCVAGAALLFWPAKPEGEALTDAEVERATERFLAEAGDWLKAAPAEVRALFERFSLAERTNLESEPQGLYRSLLEPMPGVTASRLLDELESARTILAERRARRIEALREKNRTVNSGAPSVDPEADVRFMREALEEAKRAADAGEVPVGAVLVKDGKVVARGGNRTIRDRDPTAHAEVLVLREAARLLDNHRLEGLSLYVTLEPCPMCAGAIAEARLERLVFGADDPKKGAAGGAFSLFDVPGVNHRPWVTTGVLKAESERMLKDFFEARRSEKRAASVASQGASAEEPRCPCCACGSQKHLDTEGADR